MIYFSMRKLLLTLRVIQERRRGPNNAFGYTQSRINPYNPLSYLVCILCLIIGVILFGLVGFYLQTDKRNIFKWD